MNIHSIANRSFGIGRRLTCLALMLLVCSLYGTLVVSARTSARISMGAPKDYTDTAGQLWMSDRNFVGGTTNTVDTSKLNTTDTHIYGSYRVANNRRIGLKYGVDAMDAGKYQCALHFTETEVNALSRRVFHVNINGERVETSLDIFKDANGQYNPLVKIYPCSPSSSGTITISFDYFIGSPILSGLEVYPAPAPPPPYVEDVDLGVSPLPGPPPSYVRPYYGDPNPKLPVERALYRINCGSDVDYTDKRGKVWSKDQYYIEPTMVDRFDNIPWNPKEPHPYGVDAVYDQTIYLTERYHPAGFAYVFPNVPNGKWLVRLHFVELYEGNFILYDNNNPTQGLKGDGARVFNVRANGEMKLPKVDVFQANGPYSAIIREFYVEVNGQNQIRLDFGKIVESPMVFAIEIVHAADVVPSQLLPAGRKQGIPSEYMDYMGYFQDPIGTMPDGGQFTKPVTYVQIADYYNNPNNYPFNSYRNTPFQYQFAFKVNAYLRIPTAGEYRITTESNDGSLMWIWTDEEGKKEPVFIDNDGNHVATQKYATAKFPAPGFYPIRLYYFQGRVNCAMRIYWMTPEDDINKYIPYRDVGRIIAPEFWSYDPTAITLYASGASPNAGPVGGGVVVTVSGTGFSDRKNTKCRFNHPAVPSQIVQGTLDIPGDAVMCAAPNMAGGMGSVQVIVTDSSGKVIRESNNLDYMYL